METKTKTDSTSVEQIKTDTKMSGYRPHPLSLVIKPGFNKRTDKNAYEGEDFLRLKRSIKLNGVKMALKGSRQKCRNEKYSHEFSVEAGHRRTRAVLELILGYVRPEDMEEGMDISKVAEGNRFAEYVIDLVFKQGELGFDAVEAAKNAGLIQNEDASIEIQSVPMIVNPGTYSSDEELFDIFRTNDSKGLSMYEIGMICQEAVNRGFKQSEISDKTGLNQADVSNALKVINTPKNVQELILDGKVSETAVLQSIREIDKEKISKEDKEKKLFDELKNGHKKAVEEAKEKGKDTSTAKATSRHIGIIPKKTEDMLNDAVKTLERDGLESEALTLVKGLTALLTSKKKKATSEDVVKLIKRFSK